MKRAFIQHFGLDSEKCASGQARFTALERLVPTLMDAGYIKDVAGELFVGDAGFHAAATEPVVGFGRLVEADFLNRVGGLNNTVYRESFRKLARSAAIRGRFACPPSD